MGKFFAHVSLVVLLATLECSYGSTYASNYGYNLGAEAPPSSQYHAQDDFGQYSFGFASPDQSKSELKTADGVVRGAYSYVDSNGILQTVNYIADALGFRVAATNLPVHQVQASAPAVSSPAVAEQPEVLKKKSHQVMHPTVEYSYLPYAPTYQYYAAPSYAVSAPIVPAYAASPVAAAAASVATIQQEVPTGQEAVAVSPVDTEAAAKFQAPSVPVAATGTQYHAQDDFGQYSFGYNDPNSVRQEVKTADGIVRGAYQYLDSEGEIQTVNYIADSLGFRVAGTNLPIAAVDLPVPVEDTPEVAAAKKAHLEAKASLESADDTDLVTSIDTQNTEEIQSQPVDIDVDALYESSGDSAIEAENSNTVLKPIATQSIDNEVIPETPIIATASSPEGSQYHAQDDFGQYSFGYRDGNSVKQEVKTADGVIRGAYSYVDSNGIVQSVNYIADALGFRVGATNLPVHNVATPVNNIIEDSSNSLKSETPEPASKIAPVQPAVLSPKVSYSYLPYAASYGYTLPIAAPVVGVNGNSVDSANSQFHAQADFGQYNYGFSNPTQTKQEVKTADGITRGSYSYVDANGLIQSVNYISDAMGFRVAATNLPVHVVPEGTPIEQKEVPATEEAESEVSAEQSQIITPQVQYSYLPYASSYGYYGAAARPVVQVPVVKQVEAPQAEEKPLYTQQIYYGAAAPLPAIDVPAEEKQPQVYNVVDINTPTVPEVGTAHENPVVPVVPIVQAPVNPEGSQYHAQDDFGQYSFGYSDSNSVKQEIKTADGVIRGAYSYVDSNGIVQTVNYIADALGFRVGATNLPVHEVSNVDNSIKAEEIEPETYLQEESKEQEEGSAIQIIPLSQGVAPVVPVISPQVSYAYLPYASSYAYTLPGKVGQEGDVSNAQYHAQDDFDQYSYGYSSPSQTKQEVKTGDGVTRGSYSYVDANGLLQTVNYIADAMGFRVAATNLPVHVVPGASSELPAQAGQQESVLSPQVQYSYLPYAYSYGYNTPVGGVIKA